MLRPLRESVKRELDRYKFEIELGTPLALQRRMARLIDVAKLAGVSRSTASNVFNNPDIVRPELRQRVAEAASQLGYAGPDPKGRMLRGGKFNAIAIMPPSEWNLRDTIRNPIFNLVLQGMGEACDEVGSSLVVAPGHRDYAWTAAALVDGIVFARVDHMAEVRPALLRQIPLAVIDFDPGPSINAVRADAKAGAFDAAQHLLNLGHRRFGILSFLRDRGAARVFPADVPRPPTAAGTLVDQEKYAGYAEAMRLAGLDIASMPMVQADVFDTGAAGLMLDAAPDATAILSMSAMQAINVIDEAARRGISVPDELSVVGYNDTAEAMTCRPPLTTIDTRPRQRGYEATRMILSGGPPRHHIIEPTLIVRGSTAPPRSGQTAS